MFEGHVLAPAELLAVLHGRSTALNDASTGQRIQALLSLASVSEGIIRLPEHVIGQILDLLQKSIDEEPDQSPDRTRLETSLRRIAYKSRVLPPALFLIGVQTDDQFPISGGGHADIFKGTLDGKLVALKVLRTFQQYDAHTKDLLQKKFHREAMMWRQLSHPNIFPFLGVCDHLFDKRPCMVSPWSYHGNVMEFLEKNPNHDRLKLLLDVATGLAYLHGPNRKLVHGDLKGANILIDSDLRACITDFGISNFMESCTLTSPPSIANGSLRWMPPEALSHMVGARWCSVRRPSGDVYSFACVCLELYTGKPPWSDLKNELAVMYEVLLGRRPAGPVEVPSRIWAPLIQSCWEQDPSARLAAENIVFMLWGIRISEYSSEFFDTCDLDCAETFLRQLPVEHRPRLLSALAFKVVYDEDSDVNLVAELFRRASAKNLCSVTAFSEGLMPPSKYVQDFRQDGAVAKAWERMMAMMRGAGLVKDHWFF